jgi:hypothetical protein
MRFLIFNITVLAALGFLFASAPNQSFPQWAAATLELWAGPNEAMEQDNQAGDVTQSGKRFAKAIAQVASDKIKAIDTSAAAFNAPVVERQVVSEIQRVSLDQLQPQPQPMSSEAIKDLIIAVIDERKATEALDGAQQYNGGDRPKVISQPEKPEVRLERDTGDISGDTSRPDGEQELAQMNDNVIARAFEAFEKSAVNSSSTATETAFGVPAISGPVEPTNPGFMTPSQRSADLAQMIESLNLIYFEKTGT